jgi:RNA polymerase sigma factor (sigma-70 family)
MATTPIREVLHFLREALAPTQGPDRSDGQLLTAFVEKRDETALEALLQRHAAMVWGVCRRLLRNEQDAEDAFQATFLVLVRRAASIGSRELLANWLYGVARQTALKARAMSAKRRSREKQVSPIPEPEARQPAEADDVESLLDGELNRLPQRYRTAVILCDLEGCTRKEAARQLGVPEGTVAARLARARAMLAKRLLRRGVVLSGATAAALSHSAVPAAVVSATMRSAMLVAAGQALAEDGLSPTVNALMQGVLKTMWSSKLKTLTTVLVTAAMVALGGVLALRGAGVDQAAEKPAAKATKDDEAARKKAEAIEQERKRLAGIWRLVAVEMGGKKAPREEVDDIVRAKTIHYFQNLGARKPDSTGVIFVVVFDAKGKWKEQTHGGKMKVPRLEGEKVVYDDILVFTEGTSQIDPGGNPRTIDQVVTRRVAGKGYTRRGIYEIVNKDSWRVCFAEPGKARPKSFAPKEGDGQTLWVFQRVKQEKDR